MPNYYKGVEINFWRIVKEDGVKRLHLDFMPNGCGLGSKIKGIVSAWRLNPDIEEFSTYFPPGEYWHCKFSDLFTVPNVDREEFDPYVIPSKWRFILTPEEKRILSGDERCVLDMIRIESCYEAIPQEILDKFIPYFKKLRFKDEIYERADQVTKDLDLSKCVGVLVRDMQDYVDYHRALPLETYFKKLESVDADTKLIVCCQTEATLNTFKEKYGDRVVVQQERYDAKDADRMKEVATNMVLLSRCPYLVGHQGSCFLEAAWFYGDCKAKVVRTK